MTFPVYFHLFGRAVHPHVVMEVVAYSAGSQLYFFLRRRAARGGSSPVVSLEQNLWVIVGCVFGALFVSKGLAILESFPDYWAHRSDPTVWLGGKTIVGGLLGGWAGVEVAKKFLGIRYSTGDLFTFPLVLGMALGRVGCFLTGLDDHTCGARTDLPWGVNFGDGPRHPTQLYEIAALLLIAGGLRLLMRRPRGAGQLFQFFLAAYLGYRFFIEFIHWPRYNPYLGLSAIQVACVVGIACCVRTARKQGAAEVVPGSVELN